MDDLQREVERKVSDWRARIERLPGKHVAVEAEWYGGTEGWRLQLRLVTERKARRGWWPWARTEVQRSRTSLGTLQYKGELGLSQAQAPRCPEALVAQRAADALGLAFYVQLPAELQEEERAALPADAPPRCEGITCIREESDGTVADRYFYFALGPRVSEEVAEPLSLVLRSRTPAMELTAQLDTVLDPVEVAKVRGWCEERIDACLRVYQPTPDVSERLTRPRPVRWRGLERVIQSSANDVGRRIVSLMAWHALLHPGSGRVHLFGNGGITRRDEAILMKLRAGSRTTCDLRAAFPFLSHEAIDQAVAKLEKLGFLAREGEAVQLLLRGRVL